jgi:hypothetical protein
MNCRIWGPYSCLLPASLWFLAGLFIDPEDGGDISRRNGYWFSTECAAFYPRKHKSSSGDIFILNFKGNYINFIYIVGLCVNTCSRSAACRTHGLIQQKSSWFTVDWQLSALQLWFQAVEPVTSNAWSTMKWKLHVTLMTAIITELNNLQVYTLAGQRTKVLHSIRP